MFEEDPIREGFYPLLCWMTVVFFGYVALMFALWLLWLWRH